MLPGSGILSALWRTHYPAHVRATGSFHGDMAATYAAILASGDLDQAGARLVRQAITIHMQLERQPDHRGRKYFCERWGHPRERSPIHA